MESHMEGRSKILKKDQVRPGMFVRKYGVGTFDDPLVTVNRIIASSEDIAKYIPDKTEEVEIVVTGYGFECVETPGEQRTAEQAAKDLAEALPEARRIHRESLRYVRRFMDDVRAGRIVDPGDAEPVVGAVIDNVSGNSSAALTLSFLKRFDEYTYTHCINVQLFAILLGMAMGLEGDELRRLGVSALFHDVGKGKVPLNVLNKPGRLTDDEFRVMKNHSMLGLKMLSQVRGVNNDILRGVVEHHERFDGKGYPQGISGDEIHVFGRIIAVADVYDALTSVRVYKKAMTPSQALGNMYKWNGTDFDPECMRKFIAIVGIYPPGSMVQLSDKRYAIVLETNHHAPDKPKVKVLFDKRVQPVLSECIDLAAESYKGLKVVSQPDPTDLGVDLKLLSGFLV